MFLPNCTLQYKEHLWIFKTRKCVSHRGIYNFYLHKIKPEKPNGKEYLEYLAYTK